MQNGGANPDASGTVRIGQAASRDAGFNLAGRGYGRAASSQLSAGAVAQWTRSVEAVESAPNWSISNRHLAIRNGYKMLKIKDGCAV
jgi:hypothetical protein